MVNLTLVDFCIILRDNIAERLEKYNFGVFAIV
jgi:hypothetical protein